MPIRTARNVDGKVIMYADNITKSMDKAIKETNRRREIQDQYNKEHGITPKTIVKGVREIIEATMAAEEEAKYEESFSNEELEVMIQGLEAAMLKAAEGLNFEKAAELRDKMLDLKRLIKH
jgi:excinuclease ABC subunit B